MDNGVLHSDEKPRYTLEKRLFHALHQTIHSPSIKEFKECFAFQNAIRSSFASKRGHGVEWDVVIDVAGGHGALAALFLILTSAKKAVVVDPAMVGGGGVERAWKKDFFPQKELVYRIECLRTGLPSELETALTITTPQRILVVACHACQHLSEETLHIGARFGVHVAVMPCCQKDLTEGSSWKQTSKNLSIPIGPTMDLLLAGKMMASEEYTVRMKLIDAKITPQNRIIICQRTGLNDTAPASTKVELAHARLARAYLRAHDDRTRGHDDEPSLAERAWNVSTGVGGAPLLYIGVGFLIGVITSIGYSRRQSSCRL